MKWNFAIQNFFLFILVGSLVLFGCGGNASDSNEGGGDDNNPIQTGWNATDGPFGGNINQVLASPDNFIRAMEKIYAIGAGSVFYTSNGGNLWSSKKNNLPEGEVQSISAINSKIFFVGIKNLGIYLTQNGGSSWTSVNPPKDHFDPDGKDFLALLGLENNLYYVGVNGENDAKFYEVRKGDNWSAIDLTMNYDPQPKKIYSIVTRDRNLSHFYVATDVDVFLTMDAGGSWKDKEDWIPGPNPQEKGQGIYEKLGGKAQVYSLKCLQSTAGNVPFVNEILYAGIQDSVSSDGQYKVLWRFNGLEWKPVLYGGAAYKTDKIIAIAATRVVEDSLEKDRVYVALSNAGIFYSDYANAPNPVWIEKNKLASEQEVLPPIPAPATNSLAVGFAEGQRASDVIYRGSPIYGVMLENDGNGFEEKSLNLRNSVVNALFMHTTEKRLLAATNSGLYMKDKDLDFWTRLDDSIKGNDSRYIGITGKGDYSDLLAITTTDAYQSKDDGKKWEEDASNYDFSNNILTCLVGNLPDAWVGSNSARVWYRSNEKDWDQLKTPPAQTIYSIAYTKDKNILYVGTNTGIYSNSKPTDANQEWEIAINSGIIQNKEVTNIAVSHDGSRILASVLNQGVYEGIYYYDQTRAQWSKRDLGLSTDAKKIHAIALYGDEVFIGTNDGVWYNSNITEATQKWVARNYLLAPKQINSIVIFAGNKNTIYVGSYGRGVYKTDSAGE